jgi:hypothetical protein
MGKIELMALPYAVEALEPVIRDWTDVTDTIKN